jgi:cell fate (sporulation/competence/biofilm development) regulator YlbF (YheA/YmcA/DUF963 family)
MITLSDELKQAAQALGESLRATEAVQIYLAAQARLRADPEAYSLEDRFLRLYQSLLARQQAGEELTQAEMDEFYALRSQMQRHPLFIERDMALTLLRSTFAVVGLDLSNELGLDFSTLAQEA